MRVVRLSSNGSGMVFARSAFLAKRRRRQCVRVLECAGSVAAFRIPWGYTASSLAEFGFVSAGRDNAFVWRLEQTGLSGCRLFPGFAIARVESEGMDPDHGVRINLAIRR